MLYKEYKNDVQASGGAINNDYRGYNKSIVLKVSKALDHNRPSVCSCRTLFKIIYRFKNDLERF